MPGRVAASSGYDQPGELALKVKYGWRFLLDMQMDKVRAMQRENRAMRKAIRRRGRARKKRNRWIARGGKRPEI